MNPTLREYLENDIKFTDELYQRLLNPLRDAPLNSSLINGVVVTIDEVINAL